MKLLILKISVLLTLNVLILTSCREAVNKVIIDEKTGQSMLLGITNRNAFEMSAFSDWFNTEYTGYEPDVSILEQVIDDSIDIQIFMGTWCSDSRREVPRFIKILDDIEFDEHRLHIVNLDRRKKSPTKEEVNKNIEFVPTFIILSNGNELGRIIEFPIITLKSDLLNILLGLD